MKRISVTLACAVSALGLLACSAGHDPATPLAASPALSAFEIATATHSGDGSYDGEIRRRQQRARVSTHPGRELERLGWLFVEKARSESDPGYYRLAEQAALAIEEQAPPPAGRVQPAAALLRGHALHSLHRFAEAEAVARSLVAQRGLSHDHGLLGDVLLDRGALAEAAVAYQQMMDLRPDAGAYARAARYRDATGDVEGAVRAFEAACRATSPRSPARFAWTWSQLSGLQLRQGQLAAARDSALRALSVAPDSPEALFAVARGLLAQGEATQAAEALTRAATRNPHPELLWALSEAHAAAGRPAAAAAAAQRLIETGSGTDPRGLALYLASARRDDAGAVEQAVALAERELEARADALTLDVAAWAHAAAGRPAAARDEIERALATGIRDARVLYHAGAIAADGGDPDLGLSRLSDAAAIAHALLPSERADLAARLTSARLAAQALRAGTTTAN